MNRPITRRDFFLLSGATISGAALAAAGCTPSAPLADNGQPAALEIDTPSFVYDQETKREQRILVVYATRTGSTVGVAAAVGETLNHRGYAVDVVPMKENPDPGKYQAVVLGSAVNGARWLPEAVEYVKNHQELLNQVPLALFSVHIMNLGDDETSKKNRLAYLDTVRALLQPADEAFFAGVGMNPADQPGLVRWIYHTFKIGPEGDCRNWEKIRAWAETVLPL